MRTAGIASALAVPLLLGAAAPLAAQPDPMLWERIRALGHKRPEERERAALGLAALGPAARPAARDLIEALRDEHVPVYVAASFALERIGESALPELTRALREGGTETRVEVSRILGRLGTRALDGVGALLVALRSGDPLAREAASAALGEIFDAAGGAAGHPLLAETIAGLVASLEHDSPDPAESYARSAAATTLGKLGAAAAPAVHVLVAHLRDRDPRVRTACAWALGGGFLEPTQSRWMSPRSSRGGIGGPAEVAVPMLIAALDDPDPAVRWSAAQSLAGLGAPARQALPRLWLAAGSGPDPAAPVSGVALTPAPAVSAGGIVMVPVGGVIRVRAGESSGSAGDREAVSPRAPRVRGETVSTSLRVPGNASASASGVIRVPANTGSSSPVARESGSGSRVIRVPASADATASAPRPDLALHRSVLRLHAAATLLELGEATAADRIAQILRGDENAAARELAALLLGRLRPATAGPALSEALEDSDWQVREAAASALSRIQR